MNRLLQQIKKVPIYGWFLGVGILAAQYGLYLLAHGLSNVLGTAGWAFCPKIAAIDDRIPLIAVFILIYVYSYVFWVFGPVFATLTEKKNLVNYLIMLAASELTCFLILLFAPTYIDREAEGLLEYAARPGVFNWMLRVIYQSDGGRIGYNLMPSLHCLSSMCCYLAVRRRPEVSRTLRIYSCVMVVLIAMSTVFTKQHYIVDVVTGLLIPVIWYVIVQKIDPAGRYFRKRVSNHSKIAEKQQ